MAAKGDASLPLVASHDADDTSTEKDLMRVKYIRVQADSPELVAVYDSVEQTVEIELSTFVFSASPEPILTLYDFIMTTFTTPNSGLPTQPSTPKPESEDGVDAVPAPLPEDVSTQGKILVRVNLNSILRTLTNFHEKIS